MNPPTYTVAVRVLCAFAAKRGDLDLRFTPSPTAEQGVAGHRVVAAARLAGQRSEVPVSGRHRHLAVRGRADGFDPATRRVEEVKTFAGRFERIPANHRELHRAQAMVYAWLLCDAHGFDAMTVSLVYFDIRAQRAEPSIDERRSAAELRRFFEDLCDRFLVWADREVAHRAARDRALAALVFPHAAFRDGQRQLAESVYRAARRGACLLAEAPTGIGKTVGTLFPVLKACAAEHLDKVFFLTAKGTGRRLALDALRTIGAGCATLRIVELTARDKACEHPDRACHGDACPLARGFYDRLPAAREAAFDPAGPALLDRVALRSVALAHAVCPYWLAQDLAAWSDVIVADYNHFFDAHAALHAQTAVNEWRVAVLVDEAHNLVERARSMYSAELRFETLQAIRPGAPASLKQPLDRLSRTWSRLANAQDEHYAVLGACPRPLAQAAIELVAALTAVLGEEPAAVDVVLLRFYFDLLAFTRLLETFDTHSLFDVTKPRIGPSARDAASTLGIRNVVPASFLAPRFAVARTTTLFSATLKPHAFYADTLGLPAGHAVVDVDAPFDAAQLEVCVVRSISTRYADRERSLVPIAEVIGAQYRRRPGHYLAFFGSYAYLERAADVFALRHPDVPMWRQGRRMADAEREAFLARFTVDGVGIGFAVLGGAFAEGIDLVGSRLVGAFIATLGLPQVNPVNEEMRRRMETFFGAGYDYTYLYPGLRKVTQAAGRVIRTPTDTGTIHLIDDRYARADVTRLLPSWWKIGDRPAA